MAVKGSVARLTCYAAKGVPGEALQSVRLTAGVGMEGDFHAAGGGQQITLLGQDLRKWMNAHVEPGLCFSQYKENILIEGLPPGVFVSGTRRSGA